MTPEAPTSCCFFLPPKGREAGASCACGSGRVFAAIAMGGVAGQARLGDPSDSIEEIVVTGSHLLDRPSTDPRRSLFLAVRIWIVPASIRCRRLRGNLSYNTGTLSAEFTGTTSGAPGANTFNLRSLGVQSTLTVINGRRVAPYGSSVGDRDTFVDINSIPLAAIERIEVLKDGASAIYGSDAVAGVVNIILKEHYDGVVMDFGALTTSRRDGEESRLR